MLNFLRKLRRNDMNGKYFKYAIGEIILVVVGILIALSISNWNEKRKERGIELKYVEGLILDLEEQNAGIQTYIDFSTGNLNAMIDLIKEYNQDKLFIKNTTLFQKIDELDARRTFIKSDHTYSELVSAGDLELLLDEEIKSKTLKFYHQLTFTEKVIQKNNDQKDLMLTTKIMELLPPEDSPLLMADANKILETAGIYENGKFKVEIATDKANSAALKLLQKEENQLLIINLINYRRSSSAAHIALLGILESDLEVLIGGLKAYKNTF